MQFVHFTQVLTDKTNAVSSIRTTLTESVVNVRKAVSSSEGGAALKDLNSQKEGGEQAAD